MKDFGEINLKFYFDFFMVGKFIFILEDILVYIMESEIDDFLFIY